MAGDSNLVPKLSLGAMVIFFAYGAAVAPSGATGGPVEVLGIVGAGLMYLSILMTFAAVFVAARRAYRSGSRAWVVGVVLAWPLAYVYTLAVNRTD